MRREQTYKTNSAEASCLWDMQSAWREANLYVAEENLCVLIRVRSVAVNMEICVTDRRQKDKAK